MSEEGRAAIESVNDEIKRIEKKFIRITREDKAGRIFLVTGLLLIPIGLISMELIYDLYLPWWASLLLGFLATEILITGYSLMHKSLRGAWL